MTMVIQQSLETHRTEVPNSLWAGKRNAWVRELGSAHLSDLAERMVLSQFGGYRVEGEENGYKVVAGDKYIEIRVATAGEMNGLPGIAWRNIRPQDNFTHLCFIALYPEDARMFLVPRSEIALESLGVVKGSPGRYQLITRRVEELYPWMVKHEVR